MNWVQTLRQVMKTIAILILCFIFGLIAIGLIASITINVSISAFVLDFLKTWVKIPLLFRCLLAFILIFKLISLPINLIVINHSKNLYLNRDLTWQEIFRHLYYQALEIFELILFWVLLFLFFPKFLPLLLLLWGLGILIFILLLLWVIIPVVGFWQPTCLRIQSYIASGILTHQHISLNDSQITPIGFIDDVEADSESNLYIAIELNFYEAIFGYQKTIRFNRLEANPNHHLIEVTRNLNLTIPAGISEGTQLRISEEGNSRQDGGRPGDLYIHLSTKSEADGLKRDGINILSEIRILGKQAKIGGKVTVHTLSRQTSTFIEQTEIDIPLKTKNGDLFVLKGNGVPKFGNPSERGDHIIRIVVMDDSE